MSSDVNEGIVSANSLTFTAADWNVAQTVTITAQDDVVGDGDIAFTVALTVPAGDANYSAIDPDDVAVINLDNEPHITLGTLDVGYGIGDPAFTIASAAQVTDLHSANYDGGV